MAKNKAKRLPEAAKSNTEYGDMRTGAGLFAAAVAEITEEGEPSMTSIIPDSLPTLSAGGHNPGDGQACVMEYVSILAGERFSDSPKCTDPVLAAAARAVNDWMTDEGRHMLVPLIGRLFGTAERSTKEVSIALAEHVYAYVHKQIEEDDDTQTDERLYGYLKSLLDKFDELTGFSYDEDGRQLSAEEYRVLADAVAR